MKLYDSISGQWSDYIPGGIIPGSNRKPGMPLILSVQEQRCIKKDETLKEFGLSISDLV